MIEGEPRISCCCRKALAERLETPAAESGSSKSAILTAAYRGWLIRPREDELDDMFSARLDRASRAGERVERKHDFVAEAPGTFVQHQLILVDHQPRFDHKTDSLALSATVHFPKPLGERLARADPPPTIALGWRATTTHRPER